MNFEEDRNQKTTIPVKINAHLEELDLCPDSKSRPGKPFRELLRKDQLPHAYKNGVVLVRSTFEHNLVGCVVYFNRSYQAKLVSLKIKDGEVLKSRKNPD